MVNLTEPLERDLLFFLSAMMAFRLLPASIPLILLGPAGGSLPVPPLSRMTVFLNQSAYRVLPHSLIPRRRCHLPQQSLCPLRAGPRWVVPTSHWPLHVHCPSQTCSASWEADLNGQDQSLPCPLVSSRVWPAEGPGRDQRKGGE